MGTLSGKVAMITGSGGESGFGRAIAQRFAAEGADLLLTDVAPTGTKVVSAKPASGWGGLEAVAAEARAAGGRALTAIVDVRSAVAIETAVKQALETFGRLDYAVNNAGIEGRFAFVADLAEEEWDRVLDINLKGTFLSLKYEAKAMLAGAHGGAIVNIGSINSFLGFPTGSAYVASKHALVGLTSSASAELAPHGIRVNLVCPGIIDTPMHRRLRGIIGDELYDTVIAQRVHLRRLGVPDDIAKTILFLCSDEAAFITGTTVTADGGFALTI